MRRLFTDNAHSSLAAGITAAATSLSLVSGGGALFPNPNTGLEQNFAATIVKNGDTSTYEIILVTARSTDTFTNIQRGQEGTSAQVWSAGDFVYLYPTSGDMQQFIQPDDLQVQATNYAVDTGVANAYSVALTPALISHVVGMPIRFKAAHGNTGNCTFNDGVGTAELLYWTGGQITPGSPSGINTGGIYTVIWDGNFFRLQAPDLSGFLTSTTAASTYLSLSAAAAAYLSIAAAVAGYDPISTLSGNATKGAIEFGFGIYFQWGKEPFTGSSPQTATFQVPYPNACFGVVVTPISGTPESQVALASSPSQTGFSVNSSGGDEFFWMSLGN